MNKSIKKEIENIIKELSLNCTIKEFKEFKDKVNWTWISAYQKLSENFIKEFSEKVDWTCISINQKLSENFIKEFSEKIDWTYISAYQKLSENFIKEFKDKVDWNSISEYQKLSENFIKEFKDKVNWSNISGSQKLSENFIKEFSDKVNWNRISQSQKLSENFIKEFKDKVDITLYNEVNRKISYEEKLQEVKDYCEKYSLSFNETEKYFLAFRDHDFFGRGMFNKTIFYERNKYYKDWHLDMRKNEENSFGLGIFPEGDTKVKVLIEDFGVCVDREDNKCRVWGFEIV